jgi:hypothetical protein
MKSWIKILGLLMAIGILAAVYIWFFVYNKPHRDFEQARPDHTLAANELFYQYYNYKSTADSLYTGMVLQITGVPWNVEIKDSLVIAVFAFESGIFGEEGIRCTMLPQHRKRMKNHEAGKSITLKGYCTGYNNADVIMEKCSVVDEN